MGSRLIVRAPGQAESWPGASNTGTSGTLTAYSGGSYLQTDGQVIENKLVTQGLVIQANNITIRNCKFASNGYYWLVLNEWGAGTNLLIEDCEFDGMQAADSCINAFNATIRRCNVYGGYDGIKAGSGVLIEDCYIHDPAILGADPHCDGIQCLGTNSLTIRHNTITMPVGSTSCVILSTSSADVMQNVLIDNNKMAGGVYSVYAGYQAGSDDISKVANISVTNNKFSTQFFANGGSSGAITSRDSPVVVTGNVWYDGPNAGTPVN